MPACQHSAVQVTSASRRQRRGCNRDGRSVQSARTLHCIYSKALGMLRGCTAGRRQPACQHSAVQVKSASRREERGWNSKAGQHIQQALLGM